MRVNQVLLAALDLLLLFVLLLFIAFVAVRYDADKGIGERRYVVLYDLQDKIRDDLDEKQHYAIFQPLVLDQSNLLLFRWERGQKTFLGTFVSVANLLDSGMLDESVPCVIYEKEYSPAFPDIVRALAQKRIPIGLAQIAKDNIEHEGNR